MITLKRHLTPILDQSGFSLIELMVGLVIGLIASIVIMQVFSVYEGQKRSTSGTADAQTNGSIALHYIQRDVQMAGYGLPMPNADKDNVSLNCDPVTPGFDISPLVIRDGAGQRGSDVVLVRYSQTAVGAVPVKIVGDAATADQGDGLTAENNIGCNKGEVALIQNGTSCALASIEDVVGDYKIKLNSPVSGAKITCMGNWQDYRYEIDENKLGLNDSPIVSEIVSMQAQYGISDAANNNKVVQWVDATGEWAAPSVASRNQIKAIRIVVVARNNLLEKDDVTKPCTAASSGPCAWEDPGAPEIDLSDIENWQRYRYKTFSTIIPLRNIIWSRRVL